MTLDLHDVQGLVARGYGHLGSAAFLLLTIEDAAAGRRWLGEVSGAVTSADVRRPNRALHVAFTSTGLERLGLDRGTLELFSNEFVTGMTTPHRTRILGDLEENAPARWEWGGPDRAVGRRRPAPVRTKRSRAHACSRRSRPGPSRPGMSVARRLGTCDQDGIEPFGFRDGVSQPFVEGLSKTGPPENTVKAGEFLLGYENEYGLYTDRPLLDPSADPDGRASTRRRRLRAGRSRPQRQLPRVPAAAPGRAPVLALRRHRHPDGRREERPRGPCTPRREDGRALAERRAADARTRCGRPRPGGRERLRLPRARPARCALPDRLSHSPLESSRLARSEARLCSLVRDQPAPPPPSTRSRIRPAAVDRGGAGRGRPRRPRSPLRLPERQHPAPVRVRQPHLAEQPEVRRPLRRRRPARRAVSAARGDVHDAHRGCPRARDERPTVRLGQGRRLLPPPRSRCALRYLAKQSRPQAGPMA